MEAVLDSLRRIISRWVKTAQPLVGDTPIGEDLVYIRTSIRFKVNDEVILRRPAKAGETQDKYEKPANFRILEIIDSQTIRLNQPVQFDWLAADGAVLVKATLGQFVQGIYIGDPENISHYPAITVNGISTDAEVLSLNSWKDTHNVEIGIFVLDSTQEAGYRALLRLTKLVRQSLTNNIYPLVNDYDVTALVEDAVPLNSTVKVEDASIFCEGNMILLEDPFKTVEQRIGAIDYDNNTITLAGDSSVLNFKVSDGAVMIKPNRFIFNSYPKSVQFGKIHKGTLLKAAVIQWFGWEEVTNPTGGGGWTDTTIK